MIIEFLSDFGAWSWFLFGIALLIGEIFLPGAYLLWFGLAAIIVGAISLVPLSEVSWWQWQAQVVAFGILSLVLVLIGRRMFPNDLKDDAASQINDPLARFIGHEAELSEPIENGVGRVRLGDTTWRIRGEDLPIGSKIRITGSDGSALIVEAV